MSRELTELTRARLTALQRINAEMCPDGCGKGHERIEKNRDPDEIVHRINEGYDTPCTAPTIEQLADSVLLTRILIRDILHRFGANETEYDGSGGLSLLGTIDQLQEDYVRSRANEAVLAEALEVARDEIAKAQHADDCEFVTRFLHTEPCPFWTQKYCLVDDKCVHGLPMGEMCAECEAMTGKPSVSQLVFGEGAEHCHPAPCNCWKSRALQRIERALRVKK